MVLLAYLKDIDLIWEYLDYSVLWAVVVKLLLLNPVKSFSSVNSAEGVFVIKVVLPCVPANYLLNAVMC